MMIQLLYFDGCPHVEAAEARLRAVLEEMAVSAPIERVRIADEAMATRLRFPGSPTIRVEGSDVDPPAHDAGFALRCRVYHTPRGLEGVPSAERIRAALERTRGFRPGPNSKGGTK